MFKADFEWLTSNTHVAYPFVEPIAPLNVGEANFSSLIVDAYVLHDDDTQKSVRLDYLDDPSGVSPRVIFKFEDGTTAFDSLGGTLSSSVFGAWLVVEWTQPTGSARLLFLNSGIGDYAWPASPPDAYLTAFTTQPNPNSLMSVIAGVFQLEGTVELVGGFNVEMAKTVNSEFTDTSPYRGREFVRIDVGPGLGEGVFLDCEQADPPIITINGASGNQSGNFLLDAKDCYRLEQPVDVVLQDGNPGPPWYLQPNTLQLFNDCEPCCSCEDYVYVYDQLLRQLYDRAKLTSNRIYDTRDSFAELALKMAREKACREVPSLEVRVAARHGWTATIQATIRNNQECPVEYIYLDFGVLGITRPEFVSGSGFLNSKSLRQEAFDPAVYDPCSSIYPETMMSSYGPLSSEPYLYDACTEYVHYHVTVEEVLLGTDALTITFQVYFKSYGTREADKALDLVVEGFIGTESVSATVRTLIPGPYNKV